jgi:hypothetical protein
VHVQGRLAIGYDFVGYSYKESVVELKVISTVLYSVVCKHMDQLVKRGIHPIVINIVFPARVGRTVSCDFLVDEPTMLIPTLKATQHNLVSTNEANGQLPLSALATILKKAINTPEWAWPFPPDY